MQSEADVAGPHIDYYNRLYQQLNPNGGGDVVAPIAAEFLKKSGIDVQNLSRIWEISDYRKIGSLDRLGAFIAFKLVAAVQQGHPALPAALTVSLEAPQFPGVVMSPQASMRSSPAPDWDIDPQEQAKYDAHVLALIFQSLGPVNGKLTGDKIRPVLLNSQLPHQKLAKIWELADVDRDGMLDRYEMCIALHLVYKCLQNVNVPLPDKTPVTLVHPTKRGMESLSRRTSLAGSPVPRPLFGSRAGSMTSLNRSEHYGSVPGTPLGGPPRPPSVPGTPLSTSPLFETKTGDWPLDSSVYEVEFRRLDTDADGFVNGADVRQPLLASGLPQQALAHLWALVDINKTGRLNLEQFTLIMELIRESHRGVVLPSVLPVHLIPPSLRSKAPGAPSAASTPVLAPDESNPKIVELKAEIEKVLEERRAAERDLAQLEADTTVKNSEIKNLEIELSTLSTTAKQLRTQKGEANKRLSELDDRIEHLESVCKEEKLRVTEEEERLANFKNDLAHAHENASAEEQMLYSLREELRRAQERHALAQHNLQAENSKMEHLVDHLTTMERKIDTNSKEAERLQALIGDVKKALDDIQSADPENAGDLLFKQFPKMSPSSSTTSAFAAAFAAPAAATAFPVADPFAQADPFAEAAADPFQSSTTPTAATADPFGQADPFGGASGFGNNDFADFSKFASFPS